MSEPDKSYDVALPTSLPPPLASPATPERKPPKLICTYLAVIPMVFFFAIILSAVMLWSLLILSRDLANATQLAENPPTPNPNNTST